MLAAGTDRLLQGCAGWSPGAGVAADDSLPGPSSVLAGRLPDPPAGRGGICDAAPLRGVPGQGPVRAPVPLGPCPDQDPVLLPRPGGRRAVVGTAQGGSYSS